MDTVKVGDKVLWNGQTWTIEAIEVMDAPRFEFHGQTFWVLAGGVRVQPFMCEVVR